jgi:uncharacterized integral membrane protein
MTKSVVKACGLTAEGPLILVILSAVEVGGIYGVAVKCIDTIKNTYSEGSLLRCN